MEYTPYFDTLRKTRLLRGMTDAELTLLMESLAPRVRRYDKGELLLMAGYETKDVGIILEGEITATKPMPDGTPITMARMGPGGVFADVLAGGRSKSPVNVTAAVPCLVLYLPYDAAAKRRVERRPLEAAAELAGDDQREIFFAGLPPGITVLQEPARAHLPVAAGTVRPDRQRHLYYHDDPRGTGRLPEL